MNSIFPFFINISIEGDYLVVSSVTKVKVAVNDCIGKKVKFKIKKGKSRSQFSEGIILETYPSIFTVFVENKDFKRVVSFNYIDILTNNVEFFVCNEEETRIG
jgi:uncharacterized protein Veg